MLKSLGILLVVSGCLSLVLNELMVALRRRFKPWWRDDRDPEHDARMRDFHRCAVYIGSIASIELGWYLADLAIAAWSVRLAVYALFGAWLVFRRRSAWLTLRTTKLP